MNLENIQNKRSLNESFEPLKGVDLCKVSEASVEIMLERFCKGKEIDFPFSKKLGFISRQDFNRSSFEISLFITFFEFINNKNC